MHHLPVNLGREIVSQALHANRRHNVVAHQTASSSGNVQVTAASSMIQPTPLKGAYYTTTIFCFG